MILFDCMQNTFRKYTAVEQKKKRRESAHNSKTETMELQALMYMKRLAQQSHSGMAECGDGVNGEVLVVVLLLLK